MLNQKTFEVKQQYKEERKLKQARALLNVAFSFEQIILYGYLIY